MAKAKSGAKKKSSPKKPGKTAKTLKKSRPAPPSPKSHKPKAKGSLPASAPKAKHAPEKAKGSSKGESGARSTPKETTREMLGITSLKGNLAVKEGFPYLEVVGRDKRELVFLLQGPDQEVLPAYVGHKVSVSGFIRKTTNYGGTVDVRKYSAKKPAPEGHGPEPAPEAKLKYLSPGEIEQISASGMGAGMRGFGSLRGDLEMTGEEFFLVVSNSGTRQQVSFILEGKAARALRKHVGQTMLVMGVIEKSSGWGGKVQVESFEPRPSEHRGLSRHSLEIVHVEGTSTEGVIETKINQGLTVRLPERAGYIWAIEPTMAKRVGLREANYQASDSGPGTREFFFTPRNTGIFEIEFFLAKAFSPSQVSKTFKLSLAVKP